MPEVTATPNSPEVINPLDPNPTQGEYQEPVYKEARSVKEAAENILGGEEHGHTPEVYNQVKDSMAQAEAEKTPTGPAPYVERMMASEDHAVIMGPDGEKMGHVDALLEFAKNTKRGTELQHEVHNIAAKLANDEELTTDEMMDYSNHKYELSKMPTAEQLGIGDATEFAGQLLGVGYNFALDLKDESPLIIGAAGAGFVVGGTMGLISPVPGGTFAGAYGLATTMATMTTAFAALPRAAWRQGTGAVYEELEGSALTKHPDPEEAERRRRNLARGAGAVMGLISYAPIAKIASKIPGLKNIVSPGAVLKSRLVTGKMGSLLIDIGQSGLIEGLEEGGQEITQIVTRATADTFDGTDTSLIQGFKNAAVEWETYKRTGKSALLGAAAGSAFTAAGVPIDKGIDRAKKIVGLPVREAGDAGIEIHDEVQAAPVKAPTDITGNVKDMTVGEQSLRAIRLAETFQLALERHKGTNSNELTPEMSKDMMQDIFDEKNIPNVYVEIETLQEWVNDDPKKAAAVKPLVDGANVKGHGANADIQIPAGDFMNLVYEFKDAITIAKADPEAASPVQVKNRVEAERDEAKADPELRPDTNVTEDIYGESPYIKEESTPEVTAVKEEVVEAVAESPETHEVGSIQQSHEALGAEITRKEVVESPKNISVAEDFINNTRLVGDLTKEQQSRVNKGLPAYSIDPLSVKPGTLNRYLDDPVIKRRKVFAKGGVPASDAVSLFGAKDIDHLLGILSTTPTTEESIRNKVVADKIEADKKNQPHSKLVTAYNKMTKTYLGVVQKMRKLEGNEDYRPTSARKMRGRARNSVADTKLKDLNPNVAKVAERRSTRKSKEAIVEGDNRAAIEQVENAAYNAQLAKESHTAVGDVNGAFDFMARLRTDELQGLLKDAGGTYLNVVNSILNMYSFAPGTKPDQFGAYNKFVNKMRKDFKADFRMSAKTIEWLSPTKKLGDMTVGQIKYLDTLLNNIINQATLENSMLAETLSKEVTTVDLVADDLHQSLFGHKEYDSEKAKSLPAKTNFTQDWTEFYTTTDLSMTNLNFLSQRLDGGIIGGKFSEEVYQRMMGTGKHDGTNGHTATVRLSAKIGKEFRKIVEETVGRLGFSNLGSVVVRIPEFSKIKELGYGDITKGKLVTILANLGNEGNKQAVGNWGIDPDKILEIAIRELSEKEFDFVQRAIWDQYAMLRPLIEKNQRDSGGEKMNWTEAEPFEAFGKTYAGGHFPIKYDLDGDVNALIERQAQQIDRTLNKEADFKSNPYAGMMWSPHTKERTGKDWKISIDPLNIGIGFDEVIHDVTMRIPVIETMKLIQHPTVRKDMTSIIGPEGYRMVFDMIAEQNHSLSASNTVLYRDTSRMISQSISGLMDGFSTNHILFSPRSALMSAMALPTVALRMGGVNATKYMTKSALLLSVPSSKKKDFYALTAEIDPSINAKREGGDDLVNSAIGQHMFTERAWKNRGYNFARESGTWVSKYGYHLTLGVADAALKNTVALATYMQYKAGDAPGHPIEKIQKMSPEELHENAKGYAEQFAATTTMRSDQLSKAALQKIPFVGQTITKFWNEVRNARGVSMNALSGFKADADGAVQAWRDGDQADANIKMRGMGFTAARFVMTSMAYQAISNLASSGNLFADDETEGENVPWGDDLSAFPSFVSRALTTPTGLIKTMLAPPFGSAVIAGQIMYATAAPGGDFQLPVTKALGDFPITLKTIGHMSEDVIVNGLTMQEAIQGMSRKESRAFLGAIGYLTPLKLPTSAYFQITDYMEREELTVGEMAGSTAGLLASIASWLGVYDPEKAPEDMSIEELMAQAEAYDPNAKPTAQEQAVEQVKTLRDKILPPQEGEVLSDEGYEAIKMAESTGDWRAKNEDTGAFGHYQFLASTWKMIMDHPEGRKLGLTALDRFSRDPKYQEKAAHFLMNNNAKVLRNKKVEVNIETLYHAWHFGPYATSKVYNAKKDSTKLKLSADVKKKNKWLVEKKIKTVGDMKRYITERLEAGKDQL